MPIPTDSTESDEKREEKKGGHIFHNLEKISIHLSRSKLAMPSAVQLRSEVFDLGKRSGLGAATVPQECGCLSSRQRRLAEYFQRAKCPVVLQVPWAGVAITICKK